MFKQLSIKNLLEEKQRLEKKILDQTNEVSLDLFSIWNLIQQKIGEHLVDETFSFISKKYDACILSNPVNPSSYAHFIRSDVQSKTFNIRKRTIRNGLCSGFLEPSTEFTLKPLDFWMHNRQLFAVIRKGKECLVNEISVSDQILKVSCYDDGLLIVSDIDLISFFLKNNSNEILFDSLYGELTEQELTVIHEMNGYFQKILSNYCELEKPSSFRLIAHGPANRFSNSKASHLHYPAKVCTSSSITFLSEEMNSMPHEAFLDFNREMALLGYHTYLNPKWEL